MKEVDQSNLFIHQRKHKNDNNEVKMEIKAYLQSFKKFLHVRGQRSVCKSTTMSPKLVTINTDIPLL